MPEEVGIHELYGGSRQTSGLALDRNARRAVEMSASPASPGDLLLLDLDTGASKQLTDVNAEYLAECPPATMEKFTFERGGLVIESRLWFPPDFDPSWQYPLVVDIHGGPNGAFYDAFATVQQVLAHRWLPGAGSESPGLLHLRRRVYERGAGGLGRRGPPGPDGGG